MHAAIFFYLYYIYPFSSVSYGVFKKKIQIMANVSGSKKNYTMAIVPNGKSLLEQKKI